MYIVYIFIHHQDIMIIVNYIMIFVSNKYKFMIFTNARGGTKFFISFFSNIEDKHRKGQGRNGHSWATMTFGINSKKYPINEYKIYAFIRNPYEQRISSIISHASNLKDKTYNKYMLLSIEQNTNFYHPNNKLADKHIIRNKIEDYKIMDNDNFIENVNWIIREHNITEREEMQVIRGKTFNNYSDGDNKLMPAYDLGFSVLKKLLRARDMPHFSYFYKQETMDYLFLKSSQYFKLFKIPININEMIPKSANKNEGYVIKKDDEIIPY